MEQRRVKLPPLLTQEQLLQRMERWKDPRNIHALAEGLADLRAEIGRQDKLLAALRARMKER